MRTSIFSHSQDMSQEPCEKLERVEAVNSAVRAEYPAIWMFPRTSSGFRERLEGVERLGQERAVLSKGAIGREHVRESLPVQVPDESRATPKEPPSIVHPDRTVVTSGSDP
jgi:hypothetical protein